MTISEENLTATTIKDLFSTQRVFSYTLRSEPIAARKARLKKLRSWIHNNRSMIHEAMFNDFRKNAQEVDAIEIFHVLAEIKTALDNLDNWSAPKKVDAPFTMLGTRSSITYEPKGVCLIISPWNYPFSLAIGPLVSALAAGNTVIIKPSELTPNVSHVIRQMVTSLFTTAEVAVVEGGVEAAQALLALSFDHIFFTGSPAVGRVVMTAAAQHLASVTLELGGKSPTVVASSANVREAAKRIAVAKFVNNGQMCIAPDYVLAHASVHDELVSLVIYYVEKFFKGDAAAFRESKHYCRIVNERHTARLLSLIDEAQLAGGKVAWSGEHDPDQRFIHPTIMTNVPRACRLMEEEIFGPLLPILSFNHIDEAISLINEKPKPLALYIFTRDNAEKEKVLKHTSAGGTCVNECAIHFLHHGLPFGGVSNSGFGKSHGHYGFLAFSNEKPVLRQRSGFTTVEMFYPPYTNTSKRIMDWFLKMF